MLVAFFLLSPENRNLKARIIHELNIINWALMLSLLVTFLSKPVGLRAE